MAPFPGLISGAPLAHGGIAGALVEGLVALAVAGVLVAIWLRERRHRGDDRNGELTDDEPEPGSRRTGAPPR